MLLESTFAAARMAPRVHMVSMAISGDVVPRADFDRVQSELLQTQEMLTQMKARLDALSDSESADDAGRIWAPDKVERAFDEVDENGDGVLTLEEFRLGYALLTGDAVREAFESMDSDGNGTLDKNEFRDGFAALTSDSVLAELERNKVEQAVADARIAAVKEAAKNLAEAQLMDALFKEPPPGKTRWPEAYKPIPGRGPLPRKSPSKSWKPNRPKPPSRKELMS